MLSNFGLLLSKFHQTSDATKSAVPRPRREVGNIHERRTASGPKWYTHRPRNNAHKALRIVPDPMANAVNILWAMGANRITVAITAMPLATARTPGLPPV